ncbi:MAG: MarC family protein, partial [Ginsengibacter sp.]
MISDFFSYAHFVFIGFIALFPVVNPLGSAFIVSPYFSGLTNKERRNAVKKIAFYVFILCFFVLLSGHWILELFGISVPIIQLAGGIMICKIGWDFLSAPKESGTVNPVDGQADLNSEIIIESKLFYPITFPITAGAGTISVLFTLSAHVYGKGISQYLIYTSSILLAVIGMCLLVFICYVNANKLINYLGSHREKIVNSIMAFLIFCVGLQIAVEGIT